MPIGLFPSSPASCHTPHFSGPFFEPEGDELESDVDNDGNEQPDIPHVPSYLNLADALPEGQPLTDGSDSESMSDVDAPEEVDRMELRAAPPYRGLVRSEADHENLASQVEELSDDESSRMSEAEGSIDRKIEEEPYFASPER